MNLVKKKPPMLINSIRGITNPAIQRLARKAGIKSLSAFMYEEVRGILMSYLQSVMKVTITYTEHSRRHTIQETDVRYALKAIGRPAVFGDSIQVHKKITTGTGNQMTRIVKQNNQTSITNCRRYQTKGKKKDKQIGGQINRFGAQDSNYAEKLYGIDGEWMHPGDSELTYDDDLNIDDLTFDQPIDEEEDEYQYEEDIDEEEDENIYDDEYRYLPAGESYKGLDLDGGAGVKKSYKFKPGTVALRQIRHYQRQTGHCLNIPKAPFSRLIREIAQEINTSVRFSVNAITILHMDTENYLVDLLTDANLQAIHAKRIRVMIQDIQMARRMRKESV